MNQLNNILCSAVALMLLAACGESDKSYDATGTFEATEVTVSAKATGELTMLNVVEGQEVARGTVVGTIDNTQQRLKRQQLEASLLQLRDSRRQLEATKSSTDSRQVDLDKQAAVIRQQIANTQRERQRFTEMLKDGAVARKQVDELSYQISVLEKQLAATEDQIASNNRSLAQQSQGISAQIDGIADQMAGVEAQIAQLDDQIVNTEVRCPLMGTVLEKFVEQGEFVTTGKPLFKVADTSNIILRAYVTSGQLPRVKVGQKVTVLTEYGGGNSQEYEGTVTWISPRSEFTPKTIVTDDERADLVYAVKVAVHNDGGIKIGMYGKLRMND